MTVVPFPYPAVQSAEFSTPPDQLKLPLRQMTGYGGGPRSHGVVPVNTSFVRFAPAPRRVTSLFMLSPAERVKVPAVRKTSWSGGHAPIAASICAAVLPGSRDAQIVARFGMPPGMPAWPQSIAREGSRIPEHGSAAERTDKPPPAVRHMHKVSKIPSNRIARAVPTLRVLTVITADSAATFGLPWFIEGLRENPFDS